MTPDDHAVNTTRQVDGSGCERSSLNHLLTSRLVVEKPSITSNMCDFTDLSCNLHVLGIFHITNS